MREMFKDVCLFISIVILILPAGAAPGELPEFGNYTEVSGLNKTENASRNYFDSDLGSVCIAAGKISNNEEIISADDLVEDITFLTDSPESEFSPVWTADGEYILYTVERNDSDNLESYRMRANGSEIERIGIGEGNLTGFSDLSLDGRDLVLTKSIDSQLDLFLVNLENGAVTPVTNDLQVSEGWGAWCRLGKKITYTQESAGAPSQLWIVDRDGSNNMRLGTSENVGVGKDWCPLGLRVLYSAKDLKEAYDLWVIDYYGTNQAQLTNTPYNEWNPSFSPDGKWIVYVSDEEGSPDIWIRDIEGNYRARLTNFTGSPDSVPKWSPDGSRIVFAGYRRGNDSTINITASGAINDSSINVSGVGLINSSNNGVINSSIDQMNGSDMAAINGSDIVVIRLLFEPYNPPSPKVTSFKVSSFEEVPRDGYVTISLTVKNEGGNASEGNISVSLPGKERIEDVGGTGSSIGVYSEGNPIPGINGEIATQYPLVELTEYEWGAGQEETLNVTVALNNGTEEIVFFVRAGLKDDRTETYRRDPLTSIDKDQQGFDVYRYSLRVA